MFIGFNSGIRSQNSGEPLPDGGEPVPDGGEPVPDGGEGEPSSFLTHPLFVNLIPNTRAVVNGTNVLTNGQYLYRIDGTQVTEASGMNNCM